MKSTINLESKFRTSNLDPRLLSLEIRPSRFWSVKVGGWWLMFFHMEGERKVVDVEQNNGTVLLAMYVEMQYYFFIYNVSAEAGGWRLS